MSAAVRPEGLGCDHCGDVAIEFKPPAWPGHFWHLYDGDGDRCDSCGFPGHVSVDDAGEASEHTAYWLMNDWDEGLKCRRPDCEDCVGQNR